MRRVGAPSWFAYHPTARPVAGAREDDRRQPTHSGAAGAGRPEQHLPPRPDARPSPRVGLRGRTWGQTALAEARRTLSLHLARPVVERVRRWAKRPAQPSEKAPSSNDPALTKTLLVAPRRA